MARLIGYWIASLDDGYAPPQGLLGKVSPKVRRAVAEYLDHGEVFETYRGYSWCRVCTERKMGHREFSDGTWVWPEGLSHYVRKHAIILPDEFISHALSGKAPIPRSLWKISRQKLDYQFWKHWCDAHLSQDFRKRIDEAKQNAETRAQRALQRRARDMELNAGCSSKRCQWRGCQYLALQGNVLCARCVLRGQEQTFRIAAYSDLRDLLKP